MSSKPAPIPDGTQAPTPPSASASTTWLRPLNRTDLFLTLALLGPLPFALFHAFIFLVWYYWDLAPDIAIGVPSCLFTVALLRLAPFMPHALIDRKRSERMPFRPRSIRAPSSLIELGLWYAVTAGLYVHLHVHHGFPATYSSLPYGLQRNVLLLGYATYFIVVLPLALFSRALVASFERFARELARLRHIVARVTTVIVTYVATDILFALSYRLLEVTRPHSFTGPLASFTDSFYFSTVTITTLGFGDIAPLTHPARLLVAVEALSGIILLGVFLAAAFSVPKETPE